MICSKCGSEINENQRYCEVCGTINVSNPSNRTLKNMAEEAILEDEKEPGKFSKFILWAKNSNVLFIVVNLVIYVLLMMATIREVTGSNWSTWFVCFMVSFFHFYFVCYQLIIKKAGFCWWGVIIPGYNLYILFKMSMKNGYVSVFFIIPLLGYIIKDVLTFLGFGYVVDISNLMLMFVAICLIFFFTGKRFGRSGIITVLFFYVIIPSITFSKKYQYHDD